MKEKDGCCQDGDIIWTKRIREGFPKEVTFKLGPMCMCVCTWAGKSTIDKRSGRAPPWKLIRTLCCTPNTC